MRSFKVGDKVEIIANSNSSYNKVGEIGVIVQEKIGRLERWVWCVQSETNPKPLHKCWTPACDMKLYIDTYEIY